VGFLYGKPPIQNGCFSDIINSNMRNLIISLMFIPMVSCVSTKEILPGLCHNDRDGAWVCLDQPDIPIQIDPIPEIPLEIQEILDCEEESPLNDKECVMIA